MSRGAPSIMINAVFLFGFSPALSLANPPVCVGDTDSDGEVKIGDLQDMLGSWDECTAPCPSDLNQNGIVSVTDLLILQSNCGPCPELFDFVSGSLFIGVECFCTSRTYTAHIFSKTMARPEPVNASTYGVFKSICVSRFASRDMNVLRRIS